MTTIDSDKHVVLADELEDARAQIAELTRRVETYRDLVEHALDLIWRTDVHGRVVYVNAYAEELLGIAPAESIGWSVGDYMSAESAHRVSLGVQETLLAKPPQPFFAADVDYLHKDGRVIPCELRMSAERNASGQIVALQGVSRENSARTRAEESLRESEARFKGAFMHSAIGMALVSPEGKFLQVNPRVCSMLGYAPSEFLALTFQDITHPDDLEADVDLVRQMLAGDINTYSMEKRYFHKDGHVIWAFLAVVLVRDGRGAPIQFVSQVEDITERKRTEQLMQVRQRLMEFAAVLPLDQLLQKAVDEAEQLTGSLVGFYHSVQADQRTLSLQAWSTRTAAEFCQAPGKGLHYDVESAGVWVDCLRERRAVIHNDYAALPHKKGLPEGHALLVREVVVPIFRDDKVVAILGVGNKATNYNQDDIDVVGYIADMAWEVAQRKQAEEALVRQAHFFEQMFTQSSISTQILDKDGWCERVNPKLSEIFGVSPEHIEGKLYNIFQDEAIRQGGILPHLERVFKEGRTAEWEVHFDLAVASDSTHVEVSDRKKVWYWNWAYPIIGEDGRLSHAIIQHTDISERKRAEEERATLEGQLQQAQKMESVGRLAGGVAHDFNNMLGVILGHTEMAMEEVDPALPLHADLQEIHNAAARSAALTRQLLAFARKQTVAPKVLDLNETVAGMLKMLQRIIGEDIHLHWHPAANLWPVKVDPSQIDQILANLCVNARDAITGVGKMTIETGNSSFDADYCAAHAGFVAGEYVRLAVSDDGSGMDNETLSHLFEPFYTTKQLGHGTGLGLATVYGIVKQNNGFINVYSEPNQGTTFTIYLARHVGKSDFAALSGEALPSERGHETILLVEDEPSILRMTTAMLERLGYTVLAANTAGEALRLARAHADDIHLLMTDVVMPEMNGRDLARNLLSLYPRLKRLFMSGYTSDVIAHHGVLDEGVHFIQKPFSKQDLSAKVRKALDWE